MSTVAEVRPALADVLAAAVKLASVEVSVLDSALMGHVANLLARGDARLTSSGIVGDASRWRGALAWRVETPAEAVEVLATRDLWPWPVGDDAAPRWWCPGCAGNGRLIPTRGFGGAPCPQCHGDDTHPPTLAALVAVASLGVDTLQRAEGLALQLVGRTPRVVWRVMSRERIDADVLRPTREACDSVPALRDLHALGVHPYSHDGDRITLVVEAI